MGIPLSTLIESIGISVQRANKALEASVADAYLNLGYAGDTCVSEDGDSTNVLNPFVYIVNIPTPGSVTQQIKVPATVLMHNTSLKLDSIELKLKFLIEETDEEGNVKLSIKPDSNTDNPVVLSEMTLQFKNTPPTEGMSRVIDRQLQNI